MFHYLQIIDKILHFNVTFQDGEKVILPIDLLYDIEGCFVTQINDKLLAYMKEHFRTTDPISIEAKIKLFNNLNQILKRRHIEP